ncbi:reverse transcriptase domain-containing protein, partial [Tanacetum coccineum]
MAPRGRPTRTTRSRPVTATPPPVTTTPPPVTDPTTTTSVTSAQLQAMIDEGVTAVLAARATTRNGDDSHTSGTGVRRNERTIRECTYQDFMKCQPVFFRGTEEVVNLTQWFERMETVFRISNCTVENQVKFATCTLLGTALTWWNSHARTVTNDVAYAMTWSDLKKKMTTKYCPRNEIKKIEAELWNLKVQGTDVVAYNQRFQELALACCDMKCSLKILTKLKGHFKKDCPQWKNKNQGNGNAVAKAYAVGVAGQNPDNNVVTADEELNLGKYGNTVLLGCTLNFLNHPFYVDLMPVELDTIMSDSKHSTVTYTSVSEDDSDMGSPRVEVPVFEVPPSPDYIPGPEGPPSLDYVPGPEEPEQAPPSPIYIPFVPEPVYPEFLPVDDEVFSAEEQPMPTVDSPTHQSPGYIPESDPEEELEEDDEEDPEEDPADYPADRGDDDEDDTEEEEHLAPADPTAVAYSADQ